MNCVLIDTHCHLDFYKNPERVAQNMEMQGGYVISMTNLPSHYVFSQPHVKPFKKVRLSLGLHPLEIERHTNREFEIFSEMVDTTSYIGEVGLDFSREWKSSSERQIRSLNFVLGLLNQKPKFVSLHSRGAEKEVLDILIDNKIQVAVFHWYSGSITTLDVILQKGFYFSINPSMIKSNQGRKIISYIPRDRILTETDGPFISIYNKPVEPTSVVDVIRFLSQQWEISYDEAMCQIYSNFKILMDKIIQK
ncbi:TatD family hydrolase [Leptolinea tardivitalis]|uniref:Hydrolase TatD n=1 Tax=Leptolinea tardivitalis TaxID=229920 RepID=A0A0P6XGZ0_9CHLR|nr:TatD family hydrolase [Leptolinea tardivitalis]KPL70374.1 hypothetical protein ADM99_14555 [Leptolinea tardivitalis]GAP21942.1 Mg-dependent DNase [Leptolinea tardivitalis]